MDQIDYTVLLLNFILAWIIVLAFIFCCIGAIWLSWERQNDKIARRNERSKPDA